MRDLLEYKKDELYRLIKSDTIEAIRRYVDDKIGPGGFVTAVLENNLKLAVSRADLGNLQALYAIVIFVCNEIPATSWGSEEAVTRWLGEDPEEMDPAGGYGLRSHE